MAGTGAALVFIGFFSAVGLYNALVFVMTRDRPFLWYTGIMAAMVAIQLIFEPNLLGIPGSEYGGTLMVFRAAVLISYFGCAAGFAISFLRLPEYLPSYARLIIALFALNVVGISAERIFPDTMLHRVLDDAALFAFLGACIAAGVVSLRQGRSTAPYYLLAFSGAIAGVAINDFAEDFHMHSDMLRYAFQIGMAWEALFLALALAGRVRYATIDEVTGIRNRRAFDEALPGLWRAARRTSTGLAVLFVDVDDFKGYNDTYGHLAGDAMLRRIAHLCSGACRDRRDVFARYGGDEFAAILPGVSTEQADIVATRMREMVRAACPVTISVGIATLDDAVKSERQLISCSDEALYRAKAELKGRSAHA